MASDPTPFETPESELGHSPLISAPSGNQRSFSSRKVLAGIVSFLGFLRRYWATLLFLGLALGLLGWVTWEAFWLRSVTYIATADYWEHSAVLRALIDHPWHPGNPHLLSSASSPRFGPQFVLIALVARALHLDAVQAMSLTAVFNTALFLWGIHSFFRCYFRDRLAPLYGLIVMFCSWWHAWQYSNVYQLDVYFSVASYPSTTTLALTLLGFALAVRVLRGQVRYPRAALVVLTLWAGAVFIIHQLTAVMSLSGALLLAISEPNVRWRPRLQVAATVIVGAALSHFWPYFSPWEVLHGGKTDDQWMSQSVDQAVKLKDDAARHFRRHHFYRIKGLQNALGLSLLGLVALPYFWLRPRRWFVGLGALSMLAPFAVNAFVELPLGHRFVLLAIFYLQVAVVWILLALTPGYARSLSVLRRLWAKLIAIPLLIAVLGVFGYHNVEAALKSLSHGRFNSQSPAVREGGAVGDAAGPHAVVIALTPLCWPVPTFGPKCLTLLHTNPLVGDEGERERWLNRFFNDRVSDAERSSIVERYGVSHVLIRWGPRGSLAEFLANHATAVPLTKASGLRLYALNARPIAP